MMAAHFAGKESSRHETKFNRVIPHVEGLSGFRLEGFEYPKQRSNAPAALLVEAREEYNLGGFGTEVQRGFQCIMLQLS